MKNKYLRVREVLLNFLKDERNLSLYVLSIMFVTLLGYRFNQTIGMIILILISSVILFFTNDLAYIIPSASYILFMISTPFSSYRVPIELIITASIFIVVLIIYTIINGFNITKLKSLIWALPMAISTLLPIIWYKPVNSTENFYYFLYFGDLLYLAIYMVICNGIKSNSFNILVQTMSKLGILLFLESVICVLKYAIPGESILDLWYYLGWGLCNEAGIMMCFSLPFSFYLISKSKNAKELIINNFTVILTLMGVLLTTSRGSYIFASAITGVSYFALFVFSKNKKRNCIIGGIVFGFVLLFVVIFSKQIISMISHILSIVFELGLDDHGRFWLWNKAWNLYTDNIRNIFFGPGICCYITQIFNAYGFQRGPMVFHSTFFETLATGGLIGLFILLIHFIKKYTMIHKHDKQLFIFLLIGFIFVDLYGLIDNTYHMFYYMIPLSIVFASFDSDDYIIKNR